MNDSLTLRVMNDTGDELVAEVSLNGQPLIGIVVRPENAEVLCWPDGEQSENLVVIDRSELAATSMFEPTPPPPGYPNDTPGIRRFPGQQFRTTTEVVAYLNRTLGDTPPGLRVEAGVHSFSVYVPADQPAEAVLEIQDALQGTNARLA
jgi:hypothetical protein